MWDSNAPFQLLQTMPKKLGKEHLEKLQLVLDADKYKNSLVSGFDLCGMYAPFCRECRKTSIYPCALAYINMLRSEGYGIEIDAKPVGIPADQISPVNSVPVEAAMPDGESGKTFSETAVAAANPAPPHRGPKRRFSPQLHARMPPLTRSGGSVRPMV